MILTIIITIWLTCSIIHCAKEMASPYYDGIMFLIDFIFAPYILAIDIIHEYKEWKEIMSKR